MRSGIRFRISLIVVLLLTLALSVHAQTCGTMEAAPFLLKSKVPLSPALNNFTSSDATGWTPIHRHDTGGSGNNIWSAATTIPFSFSFMGQAVTEFCVSKNYLLTFTASVAGTAVNALIADNTALPNTNLPANTIAYFWDNFVAGGGTDDVIYTRVYGSSPNRQLWIRNLSYVTEGMTFSYGTVVLEETTNKIYVIDLRNATANAGSRTVGAQKNINAYVQDPASPNITSVNGNVLGDAFPSARYWIFESLPGITETSVHYNTAPSIFNVVAPPLGGSGSFSYLWQQSTDNSTWSSASGTNNQDTYQAPTLTETTYYRRKVTDNTCGDELFDGKQKVTVTSPPVSVTISSTKASPTNSNPIPVKIDFAEDVVGFIVADITVTGGTKSNFSGSGKNYTVDIIPSGNGVITVDVAAGVAETPGGNSANLAATQFSITYDGTKPTVTLSSTTASPTNSNLIPLKIDFSENITGFTVGDLVITGGTAGNFSGAGQHYSIEVSTTVYGEITVDVAADLVLDAAGNGNTAATQFKITYDNVKPTVTISSTVAGPTGVTPIPVSIAFSENVTGFDLTDVAVTGGTSADFTGSGKNYSLNVTPSADGALTVSVAANAAIDQAGNGNAAATPFSIVYTSCTPPVITSVSADQTICNAGNTSFTVSATGSNLSYRWQVDNGSGFANITDAGVYQGSTTATLTITQASYTYNGYQYRAVVSGACDPATSLPVLLTVLPAIEAGQIAADQNVWYGDAAAELSSVQNASGADGQLVYQWERSSDGNNFSAIAGANASTYAPGAMFENTYFRRSVTNACGTATSNVIRITVTRYELDKDLIPNALFPNGTTRNQTWGISHLGLTDPVEVRVFDSAGRQLFYTNDAQQEWDGKHKGKDAPEGTYFYTIEIAGEKVQGSIQIVY